MLKAMLSSTSGVRGGSHASGSSVDDSCGHGHGHGQGHGRRVRIALDTVTEVTEVPVGADGEAEWPNAVRRAAAAARGLAEGVWLSPYAGPRPADGADDSETSFNFLCVKVPAIGSDIAVADALAHVFGYAVGVDLTRRDLQAVAKGKGQPWDSAKAFDQSAPLGAIVARTGTDLQGDIRLFVNDAPRQASQISHMIWSVPEIIAECSRLWCLAPGDLIFTGTPEGVGPLVPGDRVRAVIDGLPELTFSLA